MNKSDGSPWCTLCSLVCKSCSCAVSFCCACSCLHKSIKELIKFEPKPNWSQTAFPERNRVGLHDVSTCCLIYYNLSVCPTHAGTHTHTDSKPFWPERSREAHRDPCCDSRWYSRRSQRSPKFTTTFKGRETLLTGSEQLSNWISPQREALPFLIPGFLSVGLDAEPSSRGSRRRGGQETD